MHSSTRQDSSSSAILSPFTSFSIGSDSSFEIDLPILKLENIPLDATLKDVRAFIEDVKIKPNFPLFAPGVAEPIRLFARSTGKPLSFAFIEAASFSAAQFLLSARNDHLLQVGSKPARTISLSIVSQSEFFPPRAAFGEFRRVSMICLYPNHRSTSGFGEFQTSRYLK